MKKILFLSMAGAALMTGLFFVNNPIPEKVSDLKMENIETLGLSGSESVCDASNDSECKIYKDGKLVGEGKGQLKIWD